MAAVVGGVCVGADPVDGPGTAPVVGVCGGAGTVDGGDPGGSGGSCDGGGSGGAVGVFFCFSFRISEPCLYGSLGCGA